MARADVRPILQRPEQLAKEIGDHVPDQPRSIQFRADLAGLLVVSMAASYESAVKETLITHAGRYHSQFGLFAQNHFKKLNSRVSLSDLHGYASTFDAVVHRKFGDLLGRRKQAILARTAKDFTKSYTQVLAWRHDFAHAGVRNTTIEEALATHRLAKWVLLTFDDAFS